MTCFALALGTVISGRAAAPIAAGMSAPAPAVAPPAQAPLQLKGGDALLDAGPIPPWVQTTPWSLSTHRDVPGAAAEVILTEGQDKMTDHESDYYSHSVVRLLTAQAVTKYAQQTNEIAPDFERVTWHTLKIYRDGRVLDRLAAAEFKKLQREPGLESQLLTGEATYATVLDDVRVGDVLETAYTLHWHNPLFDGWLSTRHYLGDANPIDHEVLLTRFPADTPNVRTTVIVPDGTSGVPDALYNVAEINRAITDTTAGGERVITWEGRDLAAVSFDTMVPARAYPYWPCLRVSTFTTWADVASWAGKLFVSGQKLPAPVAALVAKWKRLPDPAQRLAVAVQWVQDDIRYFAFDLGEHTLKPRPLAEVCDTRFGDCKDKSLLLATLLRELGIEAWPALVSTYYRDRLHDLRADPRAFNHAVVAYQFGGRLRWVDPTLKNQQGRPGEWAFPPYRTALLVRPGQDDLTDIAGPADPEPDTVTTDHIVIDPDSGDAVVTSTVAIHGLQADFTREAFATTTADDRTKQWFNFVARFYRRMEQLDPTTVTDDTQDDVLTLHARFRLPHAVEHSSGQTTVALYAYPLRTLLDAPESRRRHWPYALPSDRWIRYRVEVELPFSMPTDQLPEVIKTDGVDFRIERGVAGRQLVAQFDLRVSGDFVPADRMGQFCDNIDEVMNNFVLLLRKPDAAPAGSPTATTTPAPSGSG